MAKIDDYTVKKDIDAAKRAKKRARIRSKGNEMGFYEGVMPQPMWTRLGGKKVHVKGSEEEVHILEDVHIDIDLTAEEVDRFPKGDAFNWLASQVHADQHELDIDTIATAELVLRAMARAKFNNVKTIDIDGKEVYNAPEEDHDIRDVIETVMTKIEGAPEEVRLTAEHEDVHVTDATCEVRRVLPSREHAIEIHLKGQVHEETLKRLLNYLDDHLSISNVETRSK